MKGERDAMKQMESSENVPQGNVKQEVSYPYRPNHEMAERYQQVKCSSLAEIVMAKAR